MECSESGISFAAEDESLFMMSFSSRERLAQSSVVDFYIGASNFLGFKKVFSGCSSEVSYHILEV